MTRRLMVLRHAKADWPVGVADHDRPLAKRGRRDAAAAGLWLAEQHAEPALAWVSTARRTRETWAGLAGALGDAVDVRYDDRVYEAGTDDLLEVLRETPRKTASVLLVGHNPGVQDLVLLLARLGSDDARSLAASKFPTSGLALLDVEGDWAGLKPRSATLSDFVVVRG
jgi:phosphohistidine phosphatase